MTHGDKNSDNIQNDDKNYLDQYVNLFIHWDESFWNASYVFFVVQGALIAALTQIKSLTTDRIWLLFACFFSIFGLIISIFNFFVLNRKITYTHGTEELLQKKYFKELYKIIEDNQKGLKQFSSAKIMDSYIPGLFCLFWLIIILISLINYIN